MATAYRLKTQAFPTSTGDWEFDFGAVGESVKFVLFFVTKYTDATFAAGYQDGLMLSYGFSDGTNHAAVCMAVEHGVGTTNCRERGSTTKDVIGINETTGALLFAAHVKDFTVTTGGHNGFTMTVDTAASGASAQYLVTAFAFFGDFQAACGSFTGTVGFQSDLMGVVQNANILYDDSSYTSSGLTIGFMQRYPVLSQCSRWWTVKHGQGGADPSAWFSYVDSTRVSSECDRSGTTVLDLTITGVTDTGVTSSSVAGFDGLYWAIRKTTPGPLDMGLQTVLFDTNTVAAHRLGGFRGTCSAMLATIGKVATKDAVSRANAAQCFGITLVDDQGSSVCLAVQSNGASATARSQMKNYLFDIEQVTAPVAKYVGDTPTFDAAGGFNFNISAAANRPYIEALGLGSTGAKLWTRGAGRLSGPFDGTPRTGGGRIR